MASPEHVFDVEFMELLKEMFYAVYPSFEQKLLDAHLLKPSLEDYGAGEDLEADVSTLKERWWLMNRGNVVTYLMKEKGYKCQGTQVWLQKPMADDIAAWFEDILARAA